MTDPDYRRFDIPPDGRSAADGALPGMFPHARLVRGAGIVLPAMLRGAVVSFGAILLVGYATVLLPGFVTRR